MFGRYKIDLRKIIEYDSLQSVISEKAKRFDLVEEVVEGYDNLIKIILKSKNGSNGKMRDAMIISIHTDKPSRYISARNKSLSEREFENYWRSVIWDLPYA